MSATVVLSALAGLLGVYYYFTSNTNPFKRHGIPYISLWQGLKIFVLMLLQRMSITKHFKNMYNLHRDAKYVGSFDMTQPIVIIRDPELIKMVTVKNFDMFTDHRNMIDQDHDPLLGKNLVALRGNRWREVRSVLTPAFTSSKMKSMYKLMAECATNFVDYVAQLPADKRASMDTKDTFTRYTTDVIATCAFGVNVDSMRNPENEFYVYGKEMSTFRFYDFFKMLFARYLPKLAKWLGLTFVRRHIAEFFRNLVQETVRIREEKGIVRQDMLQLMMESRSSQKLKAKLEIEDMVSQAFIFFLGGFETTSTMMCYVAHEIAVNRDVHERLQSEIDRVLENGAPTYEVINDMEYLDAVISETLRLHPIGTVLDRVCVKDCELPPALPTSRPYKLTKGHMVCVIVYGLHHDPKYFPEPDKFDPGRFLGEQKKRTLNSGVYMPFGVGPRMCIGNRFALLEIKVLIFHLLARCDLKPCEKTASSKEVDWIMRLKEGFWLEVEPRKTALSNGSL